MKITKPTFLINKNQCIKNIEKINSKAKKYNLIFRPHFKTHQSAKIGEIYQQCGITKITVSSVDMAEYFMNNGWKDITIAFPVNILEIDKLNKIANQIKLNLLIIDKSTIEYLKQGIQNNVGIFIEIDTGYHRTGISNNDIDKISYIIKSINQSNKLYFKGFLTHAGHTYKGSNKIEILDIHNQTVEKMNILKKYFHKYDPFISIGNTPSCSISENFDGIDEIRPGNFVYYDVTQNKLGSSLENEISVCLASPIIYKNKERNEIVIYGGGIHLSKEYIVENDKKIFGKIVKLKDFGWSKSLENCYVNSLSQEHGILTIIDKYYNDFQIGDVIGILPVHSCMTANLMKEKTIII